MSRTVNPQRAEQRRREILDAAQGCFVRKGFHATSMDEICSAAEISPGGLYRYFRSKEDIIAAMAEDEQGIARLAFAAVRDADDFIGALSDLCERFAQAYSEPCHAALAAELVAEACRNPRFAAIARESEAGMRDDIADLLRAGQTIGQVDGSLDADEAATILMAAADGLGLRLAFLGDYTPRAAANALRSLITRYLKPAASGAQTPRPSTQSAISGASPNA